MYTNLDKFKNNLLNEIRYNRKNVIIGKSILTDMDVIQNFMKDNRAFMMSCVAALTLGGKWKIYDQDSIKTSFPNYIKLLKFLGAKIK